MTKYFCNKGTYPVPSNNKFQLLLILLIGDFSFLQSGKFKNSTQLRCFEQSILVVSRTFLLPERHNKVSFEYKVDGASCRKGSQSCSQGLHFYLDGKLLLKSDTQFNWKKFERNVEKV